MQLLNAKSFKTGHENFRSSYADLPTIEARANVEGEVVELRDSAKQDDSIC